MCGIFAILNNIQQQIQKQVVIDEFQKGKARGPEDSNILDLYQENCMIGFHRLAINGLNQESNQPFYMNDLFLVCNGEIYNYKELYELMGITRPTTDSDCEIIIHLYLRYGIEQTIRMLDGEFSFILLDTQEYNKMYICRDPYGVRPLYSMTNRSLLGFASEVKQLVNFGGSVHQFPPGSLMKLVTEEGNWGLSYQTKYHENLFSFYSLYPKYNDDSMKHISKNIRNYLKFAVQKRCQNRERPIACLLSGGLDSSIIASLASQYIRTIDPSFSLETYCIGFSTSDDVLNARMVAEHIQSNHTEIIITEDEYLAAIPEVINAIESYDTTTVRASVLNYLVAKYIAKNSNAKVILNGDGSDELCGGYMYMHKCPDAVEFDKETRRLLKHIHLFDVLRSDKCIASNGLEARTPFLDLDWTRYYLSIHPILRFHVSQGNPEKYLLRNAFQGYHRYFSEESVMLLPDKILFRTKEAFSDGVSKSSSIGEIIKNYTLGLVRPELHENPYFNGVQPKNSEQLYYRTIFEKSFPHCGNLIPYFWMPKYCQVVDECDPSARQLECYTSCR